MFGENLKLKIVPIVTIGVIASLSSFVGSAEIKGLVCLNDTTDWCVSVFDDGNYGIWYLTNEILWLNFCEKYQESVLENVLQ